MKGLAVGILSDRRRQRMVDRVTNKNTTTNLKHLFLILSCSIFLLRSYEQGAAWHPSTPQNSVASANTIEQRGILQHHGAAWHPSTPRNSVASSNTTEKRCILQHGGAVRHPSTPRSSVVSFNTNEQRGILQ